MMCFLFFLGSKMEETKGVVGMSVGRRELKELRKVVLAGSIM